MTSAQTLDGFLATVRNAREYKCALVVQLCERGHTQAAVARLLQVSEAFVSTCHTKYARDGVASFALGYQGRLSPLRADERAEALAWIATQERPTCGFFIPTCKRHLASSTPHARATIRC